MNTQERFVGRKEDKGVRELGGESGQYENVHM